MNDPAASEAPSLSAWPDLAVIWLFALALPTIGSVVHLDRDRTRIVFNDHRLIWTVLIELASLGAIAAYLKSRDRLGALPRFRPSWTGTGLGLGLLITSWVLYYLCAWLLIAATRNPHLFAGLHSSHEASLAPVLALSVINPIFEELIVVGCVVRVFERNGAHVAIIASTVIRLSYHLYQGPMALASVLPIGLVFAGYYWKKRDLWPLIVAHAFLDLLPLLRGH